MMQAQSSPPKSLQSSSATASAYPQLSNLYPSEEASAGPSTNSAGGRPAAGPGAGFPARQPQSAPSAANAYGGYGAPTSSNLYGNGYGGGMAMGGSGTGQQGDKGEKNVAQLIVDNALAIYLLNLFLAFLQPKFDPSIQQDLAAEDVEEGAPGLPGANAGSSSKGGESGTKTVNGMLAQVAKWTA
ncbi:hypothetical protein QFC19_008005 [Naganishia cerealis]|uniref:Uncharacterized protein n=1 Tax=Naganishia cerealis TaxID=610337 RepID=A0ACC2V5Y5_9TREE|nr:hypothetical protein QFC19_008005 [Naganishia cerealis]